MKKIVVEVEISDPEDADCGDCRMLTELDGFSYCTAFATALKCYDRCEACLSAKHYEAGERVDSRAGFREGDSMAELAGACVYWRR